MRVIWWSVLFGVFFVSPVLSEEIQSRDFASGYLIEADEKGAVYSLPVPERVYRTVQRADLGDIRVYNGSGERVPHALRSLKSTDESRVEWVPPMFPLYGKNQTGQDNLSLSVRKEADGTLIAIDTGKNSQENANRVSGYLIDLGSQETDVSELEVYWQATAEHSQTTVELLYSSDLQYWRPVVDRVILIDLEYGGNRLEQRTIRLPRRPARYLKLIWPDSQTAASVDRVVAIADRADSAIKRRYLTLYNGKKREVNGQLALLFSSHYSLPVSSMNVQFPDVNSLVKARVQSRRDENDAWRERCQALFFSLEVNGMAIKSDPCRFRATSDKHWRLVIDDDGAGLATSTKNLNLSMGWQSDELLFLARGTGPFLLAYGSGRVASLEENGHSEMVLSMINQQDDGLVKPARLGKSLELGGKLALEEPPPPTPWKTWLLWAVLLSGVAAMAVMAVRLIRDMRSSTGEE